MFKGDRNFTVGVFVTVAIAVFVGFVIWLTGRSGTEEMNRYTLMFHRDVTGLAVGGPVKYMGMNIGSVIRMSLDKAHGMRVRVDIEILADTPVDQGTYASLALQGITGVAVVNLASEPGVHEPLPEPPRGQHPEIPVRDVGFAALMASAPELMNKLDGLLTQAGELLGEDNRAALSRSLGNVESLTASLAGERDTLAALPRDLRAMLADLQATAASLRTLIGDVQPGLDETVQNLSESSANLARLTGRIDRLLIEHEQDVDRFMAEGLAEMPQLMRSAGEALRDLEKLVAELRQDPSQLIHRPQAHAVEIDP